MPKYYAEEMVSFLKKLSLFKQSKAPASIPSGAEDTNQRPESQICEL